MNRKQLAQVGLKWDPFATELPIEAIYVSPKIESFQWRLENALIREGGFCGIKGDSGTGKSTALRLLEIRELGHLRETHGQGTGADLLVATALD